MKNGKPKKPSKQTEEQKAINIWQSLSSVGVGWGSYGTTLAADLRLLSTYVNHPFVYGCAELNANSIAAVPFKVYKVQKKGTAVTTKGFKGRKLRRKEAKKLNRFKKAALADDAEVVELSEHELYDMLNTDAEDLRGVNIIKATQLYLEILGRAYWLIERSAVDESPISIRVLRSEFITPNVDAEGIVLDYFYLTYINGDVSKQKLDKENIIDFRNPALTNLYAGGQSWVRAAYERIAASSKWFEYINRTLDNKARPDYIASPVEGDMDEKQVERERTKFLQKVSSNNNGGPIFLEKSFKLTPLFFQPTDLAGLQISNDAKKDIAVAAGIPGPLVGVEDKTYNTYETALEDYARRAMLPRCRNLEDVFNARLIPLFGDEVFIEFDNPVPEDEEFELEEQKVALQKAQVGIASGKVTGNEVRAFLGLDEIDDAAEDELITPAAAPSKPGTLPPDEAGGAAEGSKPKTPPGAPDAGAEAEDGVEGKSFDRLLKLNVAVAKGKVPRAIAINIAERLGFYDAKSVIGYPSEKKAAQRCGCTAGKAEKSAAVNAAGAEQPHAKIQAVCAKFFKDLGAEAIRQTKSYKPQLETKADDTGNLPTEFVDLEDWANNLRGKEDDLAHRVKPLIQLQAQEGADGKADALVRAGADPDVFSVVPAKVGKAADKRAFRFAQSTLNTTRKNVQDAIDGVKDKVLSGLLEGDSVDELRRAVSEVFENASDYQAERIARTEASAAVHSGQVMAAKASGIVKGFKYLVSSDACPVCQDYEGQTIDLADYDDSGAVDAEDAVPLHPNCTCTMTEILDLDGNGSGDSEDEGDDNE